MTALSDEPDEKVTLGVARWRAAHRAARDAGDPARVDATRAVLDGFLAEARRRGLD